MSNCRFGSDPDSSVLDTDCRTHERDHLLERLGTPRTAKETVGAR